MPCSPPDEVIGSRRERRPVSQVNLLKAFYRDTTGKGQESAIIKVETPIYACKVMVVCPKCNKPTRVAHKVGADGKKARVCKHCGAEL